MTARGKLNLWLTATCLTSGVLVSGPAAAQATTPAEPTSAQIEEVIVTAQRRSERLQDVPIAVTAIDGEALAAKGVTNTAEVFTTVPGLTFTQVIGTATPRIRGIGTAIALGGNENSVATYVDGVYYASSASSIFALSNIAQIAVLKGPQGTLFGRNATGGLIQVTTREPDQTFSGNASASYGNHDTIGGALYVTGGVTPRLAADLAVYYNDQNDGFGRNLTTGAEVNKARDLAIRSKWLFDLGEETTLRLSGDYGRLRVAGPGRRSTDGSLPATGVPFHGDDFDTLSNANPFYRSEQGGGSAHLVHHFAGFDLVNTTAYRRATTHTLFDIDGTQAALGTSDIRFEERQISQELQVVSSGDGPLSWTLGAYYFRSRAGYANVILDLPPVRQTFATEQKVRSPAAYAQAAYKFDPVTSLTLGFRYSGETREFEGAGRILTKATGVTTLPPAVAGKLSVERPTWRIALDRRLSPDALVYVSYNRGFKSGGFNGATFLSAQPFKPETLDAYEVGLKSDLLDRRLRFNAAVFYYDYKNIQLTSFLSPGVVNILNATSAEIYGLDVDITAKPMERLTLTAGFSYLHSRFGAYPNAQVSSPLPAGGNRIVSGSASGNTLPQTPDWTVDLGADYTIPLSSGSLLVSGHYFHSDGWYAEPDNRLRQSAYDILNASLTWRIGDDERVSLTAWGKNLTDEAYAATLQTQAPADVLVPAPGRTFGATVGYKF